MITLNKKFFYAISLKNIFTLYTFFTHLNKNDLLKLFISCFGINYFKKRPLVIYPIA